MDGTQIIDAHVHIGTGGGLHRPWDTEGSLSLYAGPGVAGWHPRGRHSCHGSLTSDYPRRERRDRPDHHHTSGAPGRLFVNLRAEAGHVAQ
jgi:hypothetical protein